jgi:FMN phosphatase YigB (HAD superfamily)
VHAGDDLEADVEGARAAGIAPVLVARDGAVAPAGVRTIPTLEGLLAG